MLYNDIQGPQSEAFCAATAHREQLARASHISGVLEELRYEDDHRQCKSLKGKSLKLRWMMCVCGVHTRCSGIFQCSRNSSPDFGTGKWNWLVSTNCTNVTWWRGLNRNMMNWPNRVRATRCKRPWKKGNAAYTASKSPNDETDVWTVRKGDSPSRSRWPKPGTEGRVQSRIQWIYAPL
jgi:hypothetical protein